MTVMMTAAMTAMPATRERPVEPHNAQAGQGAVLVDIGGDVGALVVVMPVEMTGVEVEIRPADPTTADLRHDHVHDHAHDHVHDHAQPAHHPHVAVVVRPTPEGALPSLVYPSVVAGDYVLVVIGDEAARRDVSVEGGVVTTTAWV